MKQRHTGRQPDYELRYLNKETDEKGSIGAAWENDDGSIRVKLNCRVAIVGEPSCILTLFKWQDPRQYKNPPPVTSQEDLDERPF